MTSWAVERHVLDPQTGSRKFLLRSTRDGVVIESVLVWFGQRRKASICASVQRGCPLGCVFCATSFTEPGHAGNLSADELVDQVETVISQSRDTWDQAAEQMVVYEGHGEVALNLEAALEAVQRLHKARPSLGFKMVSCCPGNFLDRLLALDGDTLVPELRISLHATDRERRGALMPAVRDQEPSVLVQQAIALSRRRGFQITWGYLVHAGNSTAEDACALAELMRPGAGLFKLRLQPMNPVPGSPLAPVSHDELMAFQERVATLLPAGIVLDRHVNQGRSDELRFACGQLRAHAAGG